MLVDDFATLVLTSGAHDRFEDGVCLLEAVAYVAGEPHTDHPKCVSPVLAAFGREWNDGLRSDEERSQLKQYIPRLIGTAGDKAADERRAWLAVDWLVRVCAPAFLRLTPSLAEHADRLAALPPITGDAAATSVQGKIEAARNDAVAVVEGWASSDAWAVASAGAAGAAASAFIAASGAEAVTDMAIVWTAIATVWSAAWWAAAGDVAGNGLEQTIQELQESAHQLFNAMIVAEAPAS